MHSHNVPKPAQLFGLCGFIGSGKNAAADELLRITAGAQQSFAAPLKDAVAAIFGWPRHMIEGTTAESRQWREQPDAYWSDVFAREVTPRMILQEVGTNVFRAYCPPIWIHAAGRRHAPPTPSVYTDCRFGNEMQWVRDQQGTVIWIYRPEQLPFEDAENARLREIVKRRETLQPLTLTAPESLHRSEYCFLSEGAHFIDVVIENTGTLADLQQLVRTVHTTAKHHTHQNMPWGKRTLYVRVEPTSTAHTTVLWQWRDESNFIKGVLEAPTWFQDDDTAAYGHGV